jgi:RNA polymerase sigma-70 factor (ECF subfamily)
MNSPPPETRASLLIKLQNVDDVDAWETFVKLYSPALFRTARKLNLQPVDAENVVQEVLLVVAKSVGSWLGRQDRGSFMAWLLRIARNKSVDLLTRRATKPMRAVTSLDDPNLSQIAAMQSDAEIQLDREYRWELFNQAAEEAKKVVSEQTWKAFWMTTVESVSIEDAARILQVRPGVIYLSRCRVMERIKQLICKWEAGYDE